MYYNTVSNKCSTFPHSCSKEDTCSYSKNKIEPIFLEHFLIFTQALLSIIKFKNHNFFYQSNGKEECSCSLEDLARVWSVRQSVSQSANQSVSMHRIYLLNTTLSVSVHKFTKILLHLTHCGRLTQICVFNTVKLGTSASSP